jgi:hypothetical protein
MPFSVSCPGCGAKLKAPDSAAGRILNCPGCLTPVQMPLVAAPASPPRAAPPAAPPPPRNPPAPPTSMRPTAGPGQRQTDFEELPPPPLPVVQPLSMPRFDQLEEVKLVGDEEQLDVLEEVPPEESLDSLEEVSEQELESLEEVLPAGVAKAQGPFSWSVIFRLSLIHVRGRLGSALGSYDLCDPRARKRLGEALEVRESALMQAGGVLETTNSARSEIREGRYGDLVAMVLRPADDPNGTTLQVVDDKEEIHGKFEKLPWKKLTWEEPIIINMERGRKMLVHLDEKRWRLVLKNERGEELGEMIAESAYEGRQVRPRWFGRGNSFYLRFRPVLDSRPRDKLMFLAVILGMDL